MTKNESIKLNLLYNDALLKARDISKEKERLESNGEEYSGELDEVGLMLGEAYAYLQGFEHAIKTLGLKDKIKNYRWK